MPTLPDSAFTVNVEREEDLDPDLSYYTDAHRYADCTWEEADKYKAQDAERLASYDRGDWTMLGVVVTVFRNGVKLAEASCWGIESDSEEHLQQTEADLTQEALEEARATLAKLCDCHDTNH